MNLILVITRAIHLCAALLLASFSIFGPLFLTKPGLILSRQALLKSRFERLQKLIWIVGFTSWIAWLGLVTTSLAADGDPIDLDFLGKILIGTHFGHYWIARTVLWLAIGAILRNNISTDRLRILVVVLSFVQLSLIACIGHTGSSADRFGTVHLINGGIHLAAAAMWPGCLFPLFVFLTHTLGGSDLEEFSPITQVVRRFSFSSIIAVTLLSATGLVNSLFAIGDIRTMFDSHYGRLLAAKIGAFLIMAGIGAWNLFMIIPGLDRLKAAGNLRASDWKRRALIRNVVWELSLGTAAILIVAILGITPPPQA
jgi:copper resistance protein D